MAIFFYLFAILLVMSSVLVVISKNPVYSVLWLIFAFCNASGLMVLLGAEFIAMMLIIIYVGAVAVLFLFVVMMLNINLAKLKIELKKNLMVNFTIGAVLFANLALVVVLGGSGLHLKSTNMIVDPLMHTAQRDNVSVIGQVLYTKFILPFQTSGLILFVAIVACISLTLRYTFKVRRQDVRSQLAKNKENSLILAKPTLNSGISEIKYD